MKQQGTYSQASPLSALSIRSRDVSSLIRGVRFAFSGYLAHRARNRTRHLPKGLVCFRADLQLFYILVFGPIEPSHLPVNASSLANSMGVLSPRTLPYGRGLSRSSACTASSAWTLLVPNRAQVRLRNWNLLGRLGTLILDVIALDAILHRRMEDARPIELAFADCYTAFVRRPAR